MAGDRDRIALIHALAELAGRHISDAEAASVLDHHSQLQAGERDLVPAPPRAGHVSLRDYLAMTLRFLDQAQTS